MGYTQAEKAAFTQSIQKRFKTFVVRLIRFCETLPASPSRNVINYQIIKSGSSAGANYRAACRARSKAEFFSKMSIVVEEADETEYWLEIIKAKPFVCDAIELEWLLKEIGELLKIVASARSNTSR